MKTLTAYAATIATALALSSSPATWAAVPADGATIETRSLGTITVNGSQLQALQDIKAALHRAHSYRPADADELVCSIQPITGSPAKSTLDCETNRQWWQHTNKTAIAMTQAMASSHIGGGHSVSVGKQMVIALQGLTGRNMAFQATINKSRFKEIMRNLPLPLPELGSGGQPDQ